MQYSYPVSVAISLCLFWLVRYVTLTMLRRARAGHHIRRAFRTLFRYAFYVLALYLLVQGIKLVEPL